MRVPSVGNKSILVTGCSSGIGLSTAELLRSRGWKVFPTARKLADELHGRLCDDHRSVLTRQAIDDLRASLNTYDLKQSLAEMSREQILRYMIPKVNSLCWK